MDPPQLVVLGFSEAAMFLRQANPRLFSGIISIHGTGQSGVESKANPRLDLTFDDVDVPPPGDHLAAYHLRQTRLAREALGLHEIPPTREDARAIIDFARSLAHKGGLLLIHCHAGISRSPAAALLCLATWQGPGRERQCVEEILRIRASAMPLETLVRFGDDILNCQGILLHEVQKARADGRLFSFRPAPKPT